MTATRIALIVTGIVVAAVGAWHLLALGFANLVATVWWLVAGVLAHDGLLAPATIGLVLLAAWVVPRRIRTPATVGFVVLGTVTVLAIPVLGRFGARPDNPTLLDRNYTVGWLVFAGLVVLAVVAGVVVGAAADRRRVSAARENERNDRSTGRES